MKLLIDKNAKKKYFIDRLPKNDQLVVQEILRHAYFARECVKKFHGRVSVLNEVCIRDELG